MLPWILFLVVAGCGQVHGCAHCTICSVLLMLIDEHLPEATVHIERMQGKNVFRVLQANTELFELEGDDEYCFFEDLMQLLHMECCRVCPCAQSILVTLRDSEVSPQACIKPRYAIKVFTRRTVAHTVRHALFCDCERFAASCT